jgi:hypothetical protein
MDLPFDLISHIGIFLDCASIQNSIIGSKRFWPLCTSAESLNIKIHRTSELRNLIHLAKYYKNLESVHLEFADQCMFDWNEEIPTLKFKVLLHVKQSEHYNPLMNMFQTIDACYLTIRDIHPNLMFNKPFKLKLKLRLHDQEGLNTFANMIFGSNLRVLHIDWNGSSHEANTLDLRNVPESVDSLTLINPVFRSILIGNVFIKTVRFYLPYYFYPESSVLEASNIITDGLSLYEILHTSIKNIWIVPYNKYDLVKIYKNVLTYHKQGHNVTIVGVRDCVIARILGTILPHVRVVRVKNSIPNTIQFIDEALVNELNIFSFLKGFQIPLREISTVIDESDYGFLPIFD